MTTTLRPAGAERAESGGGRSRDFTVCVNGRAVGALRLAAEAPGGSGRIEALTVAEPDRRRGRGTVAALAAEEVLRQWGCTRVTAAIPPEAVYGLRIARALGYTEAERALGKCLTGTGEPAPAPVPEGFRLYEPVADSAVLPGSRLFALDAGGATVGRLWLRTEPEPAWVLAVEVPASHHGLGLGRALLLAAESACRSAGVGEIGLNVVLDETAELDLYAALGYEVRTHNFGKSL
ncbi:GNAT family N-acetyltransferase [Streptomyces sp. NRRL F-5123]|uniref:GNAT family N-acetyltransferase n=1 Tax=Streptomyces sp. NRRL F-5123 TaxID=1463856 RepID=UPI0006949146|nr:GNAT family N-acetyltransferase [Streptomyces sp. NRRL F-5123]